MIRIILSGLFLLVLYSLSHFVFEPAYMYFEIWWLDIPMHILGGLGVASLVYSILIYLRKPVTLLPIIVSVFVVAVTWEIYEYVRGVVIYDRLSSYLDTVKDLIDGTIGAYIAYLVIKK
jgi:hypothetical protein